MASSKREKRASDKPRITPSKAKNAIGVAKVLGPAVLPVVVPHLIRGAAMVRSRFDALRARRLGVPVEELSRYSGRGGALHARISGLARSLADLRDGPTPAGREFATRGAATLHQLAATVRAAETMPTPRRRAAHQAVSAELDRLEQSLLDHLGDAE